MASYRKLGHGKKSSPQYMSRKRLTNAILNQKFRNVQGLYNTIIENNNVPTDQQATFAIRYNQESFSGPPSRYGSINRDYQRFQPRYQRLIQTNSRPNNLKIGETSSHAGEGISTIDENLSDTDKKIADEVRRRLSLSMETSIPRSFIAKHLGSTDKLNLDPLSRVARRQSLSEIGFGQLATYVKSSVIGSGTYSTVYKGTSLLNNKPVALKVIHLERDEGIPFTALREVSLLKDLRHCNIILLHDIIYTRKTLTLVFEYVERDLSKYMSECNHIMNLNNVRLFLFQLLRALKFCHNRRILHRDIKPQNILINLKGELKLADFGLARAKSVPMKNFTDEVVTLWYRPPDVLLGNTDYGTSIDMWGVGCIFFEMIAGFTLFTGTSPSKQIELIFETTGDYWPGLEDDLRACGLDLPQITRIDLKTSAPRLDNQADDLLRGLLKCNPETRISAHEALMHKYFNLLPKEVYNLEDLQSIFCLKSIEMRPEIIDKPIQPY